MSEIVKRKKGRPSKADLARRMSLSPATEGLETRRSLRPRNAMYNFDFDDFLDEEEEDEEDDDRRREKKLKMNLKLNRSRARADPPSRGRGRPPSARGKHASDEEGEEEGLVEEDETERLGDEDSEDEVEDENVKKPVKKRKINVKEDKDYEEEELVDYEDDEEGRIKEVERGSHSGPGTPSEPPSGTPMPDKKSLDLILDKLQKKDIYGVYAEPVDPEELPDYHEMIKHPMDFATVRKKLADVSYSTLEEFESDVFLICANAMQYNSPDTVYYKHARTIQEMAKKKFQKIRGKIERAEKELKSVQKNKASYPTKKELKKPSNQKSLEPVGSDLSSGVNLATRNSTAPTQAGGYDKHHYTDGHVEGNTSFVDYPDKAEELSSGKSLLGKFGRKQPAVDEDRRATYSISNHPSDRSKSVFSTFGGEVKQLVTVGLHSEHAHTRSLARFASTLGPIAWKVASQRIQQALPPGVKFGRGWVGEYEPLPTPALLIETKNKEVFPMPRMSRDDPRKSKIPCKVPDPVKEKPIIETVSEARSCPFRSSVEVILEGKPSYVASPRKKPSSMTHQQNPQQSWTFVEPQGKIPRQVELNLPPSGDQNVPVLAPERPTIDKPEARASRPSDATMRNVNLVQSPYLNPAARNGGFHGGLPNGIISSSSASKMINLSSDTAPSQMARPATSFLPHAHDQGLSDPVQLMRSLTGKPIIQQQQQTSNQPQVSTSSVPSIRADSSSNATAAAARAWMSIGSGGFKQTTENSSNPKNQISVESLYNPAREFHPQVLKSRGAESPQSTGMQYHQNERNSFPFHGFVPQQIDRPVMYPQLVTSEFPRFQVQSPWRGVTPHVQLKQRQDNLPPDLNIGVQSPDSPAKQSSGVRVDSQQPDLALQL